MSPCPSPRHAMRRRTGATPLTIFRVPRASRFDSGRFDSGRFESGDDIGEQLVLAPTDLVAQLQLLLLEPGELELVGNRRRGARDDRGVAGDLPDAARLEGRRDGNGVWRKG